MLFVRINTLIVQTREQRQIKLFVAALREVFLRASMFKMNRKAKDGKAIRQAKF